jgi:hypothetical protein
MPKGKNGGNVYSRRGINRTTVAHRRNSPTIVFTILGLFLVSGTLGVAVSGGFATASITLRASPSNATSSRTDSVGESELGQSAQSLYAGGGPASGAVMSCGASAGVDSAVCSSAGAGRQINPVTSPHTTPGAVPVAREDAAMSYDGKDGYVVLFGGYGSSGYLADTWKYVGGAWTELTLKTHPSPREGAVMTYDGKDGYLLLFGGVNNSGGYPTYHHDSWKFSGGAWTKLHPTISPPAGDFAPMTYDAKDGYVILLVSPFNGNPPQTWKFLGGAWTLLKTPVAPSSRWGSTMAYDGKDGYVILFGGQNSGFNDMNDTWKFVGGSWAQIFPRHSPPPRDSASMTYDAKDQYLVLFAGFYMGESSPAGSCNYGMLCNDTWKFVGGQWTRLTPSTSPRVESGASLTYDAYDHYVLLFGTGGATWKFVSGQWTKLLYAG